MLISFIKGPSVYILGLEDEKYYVGYSENVDERIEHHFDNRGAKWTRLHKPIKVINVIHCESTKEALLLENEITLKVMKLAGWKNVRGGSWCAVNMDKCPLYFRHLEDYVRPSCWAALRKEILSYSKNTTAVSEP